MAQTTNYIDSALCQKEEFDSKYSRRKHATTTQQTVEVDGHSNDAQAEVGEEVTETQHPQELRVAKEEENLLQCEGVADILDQQLNSGQLHEYYESELQQDAGGSGIKGLTQEADNRKVFFPSQTNFCNFSTGEVPMIISVSPP